MALAHSSIIAQITHHLLYSLEIEKTQSPLIFLDIGYGEPEFLSRLFQKLPLACYTLYQPVEAFCLPNRSPDFFYHVVGDSLVLPFAATFDVILVGWKAFLSAPVESLIRQLVGCLKPGGRLYFVALGECSFYEWFYACQHTGLPFSLPSFLTQRQPLWPDTYGGSLQEEWIVSSHLELEALLAFFDHFQKNLGNYGPFARPELERAFDVFEKGSKGYLTLHLFYGYYKKPEEIREE